MRLPASPLVAAKPDHRQSSRSAISIHGSPPYPAVMPGAPTMPRPSPRCPAAGSPSRSPRWGRADPLCGAGRLARVLAGTERPPLPDRGLRRPPTATGQGQRPYRL